MKRQALDHTKMDLLMGKLHLPRWGCVGILESLWHLTAREAPRGDIGKLSDERIGLGLDWRGAANRTRSQEATRLVQALTEAGWIDSHQINRLVVHDWPDHADEAIRKYIKRNKLQWACRDTSRHVETRLETSSLPVPVPEPVPAPASEPPPPLACQSEYPLTIAEIRKHDAAVDEFFVIRLIQKCTQHVLSHPTFPQEKVEKATKDKVIASACRESFATGPSKHGTGLLLARVPPILVSWGLEKPQ